MIEYHDWTGRIDSENDQSSFRIHEVVDIIDSDSKDWSKPGVAMIGYACDEGVRRNKGRIGSIDGPDAIRSALSNMVFNEDFPIYDLGSCICQSGNMELVQMNYAEKVCEALTNKQMVIGLGGGQDIAYGSWMGIDKYLDGKQAKPDLGIINIDAHFDLRRPNPQTNSGTPFYQIANQVGKENFHYLPVGIQHYSNTAHLFKTADHYNVQSIFRNDIQTNLTASLSRIKSFIEGVEHIYFTIDLDGFDVSHCPGVSAPAINGLTIVEVLAIIDVVLTSDKVILLDIAELNPTYDMDNRTAKLAAYLIYQVLSRGIQ